MHAIVDADGNVLELLKGTSGDVEEFARARSIRLAGLEHTPHPDIQEALPLAVNPDRVTPNYAWERANWLQIHHSEAMSYSLEQAHAKLLPFFPRLSRSRGGVDTGDYAKTWRTPSSMAKGLLGQNTKTSKDFPFGAVSVKGLALVPASMWALGDGKDVGVRVRASDRGGLPIWTRGSSTNLCVGASAECIQSCLVFSGHNTADPYNLMLKQAKTSALMVEPAAFGRMLYEACKYHQGTGRKEAIPMVRLNVFSDIPWELVYPELFSRFPELQFYDYTKVPDRVVPPNYDLTFSYSGRNLVRARNELALGRKVAVVFLDTLKWADSSAPPLSPARAGLPNEFLDFEVIDGDTSDIRPLDVELGEGPAPYVVGLRWKRPLGQDVDPRTTRFAVPVQEVDGRLVATIVPRDQPDLGTGTETPRGYKTEPIIDLQEQGLVASNPGNPRPKPGSSVSAELKQKLMR